MTETNLPDQNVNKKGMLAVGDGHKIYWEDWGNPKGFPIIHLHGGPGTGFTDSHKLIYNSKKNRVIFHDQRGCGKSTPLFSLKNNTTQDLIGDIEKLCKHLKLDKVAVVGGSWGSTLSLLYTIAHAERVSKLMMWGIYLVRPSEQDYLYQGGAKDTFPEAWERFIGLVPAKDRTSAMGVTKFYASKMASSDKKLAQKYAAEWALWESSCVSLRYDKEEIEKQVFSGQQDDFNLSVSKIETHFFLNNCFIPDGYILDNLHKIKHIPAYVVQGRFDMCTPPVSAVDLAKSYGDNLDLQIVSAGHLRSEPEVRAVLRTFASSVLI